MKFIIDYPLSKLRPADYNPRKITEGAFEKLQESISKFGICKPVILNGNGVLTAGHQRTKAMKALGIEVTPVIQLPFQVSLQDEIKFNLFHNSIETNDSEVYIDNIEDYPLGYSFVPYQNVNVVEQNNGSVVKEISSLIAKYGIWGSVITDEEGRIIMNSDYAVAVKTFKKETLIFKLENSKVKEFLEYLGLDYGEYNYDTLGIKSYNQLHCQMSRLRGEEGETMKSTTYENYVLPRLKKNHRLMDFGAGKMDYVKRLRKLNYNTHAYEPHFQKEGSNDINIKAIVGHMKDVYMDLKAREKLFDIVVLDSVLNSIVNNDFEHHVLVTCNALTGKNGTFITGTRNLRAIESKSKLSKANYGSGRLLEFLDKDNFSATFRSGVWTMQKFHTAETLHKSLSRYFHEVEVKDSTSSNIYGVCSKPKQLPLEWYEESLNIEFNMDYPNGYKHNKQKPLVDEIIKRVKKRIVEK
jgi:hypothetical protein